jgi:hypothetical protein
MNSGDRNPATLALATMVFAACGAKQPAAASPTSPPPLTADVALMDGLGTGKTSLASVIDPEHGVLIAERLPGAMETPNPDHFERVCGDQALAMLRDLFATQRKLATEDPEMFGWRCERSTCSNVEGGEWSAAREYRFASAPGHALRLVAIVTTEVGSTDASNAEFLSEVDSRVTNHERCK